MKRSTDLRALAARFTNSLRAALAAAGLHLKTLREGGAPALVALARSWSLAGARGWLPVGLGLSVFLFLFGVWFATPRCEEGVCLTVDQLRAYFPPEPPRVYDGEGQLIGQLPGERRLVVELDEIPPLVRDGFVAVEDRRFWRHSGVDLRGLLRAATRNLSSGAVEQGASTITMQLVRNVFDVRDFGRWRRKMVELRLALAVEDLLPKEQILELYLNQIYLGGGVYGVETAARSYFGKPVSELDASESALLVGLAKNPEGYNPRRNPERALERRALILEIMVREGLLTTEQAQAARGEDIELVPLSTQTGAYFLAAVDRQIRELVPDPRDRQGLRLHTGYDARLQESAEAELVAQIERIESGRYGSYRHPVPDGADGDDLERSAGSSAYLQGMVVALDPASGAVRALVGGRDFEHSEFDRALQAQRQPGSAFKPLVWTAALEEGRTLSTRVETTPIAFRLASGQSWQPEDGQSDGTPLSMREALVRSSNSAAVRVGQLVGVEKVAGAALRLGIASPIPPYPSVFLGAAEVVPVELVAAFAAFGNGGKRIAPHLITRIEDREGTIVWTPDDRVVQAIDPGVAYLTLSALEDVVDHGTGWRVRESYRGPAAGKTGTTDGGKDVWFVGLTPEVVAGIWLGFDEPRTILPAASGGLLAAPVWGRMMREAYDDRREAGGWTAPDNVMRVRVDAGTGYLATPYCPLHEVTDELFLAGTEPVEQCPVHQGAFFGRLWRGIARLFR